MRGLRSFGALLVILIALGAYLYFVDSKRTPGNVETRDRVFTVEADAIDEVAVRTESGERTLLRKTGADWQIVEPAAIKPDAAEVSSLTTSLASLEIQRVVEENAADLAEFGLEKPRIEVTFNSGGQARTLRLGAKTPSGADLYARLDDERRVFLVPAHIESTFNQTTFDLRDKRILVIDRDAVSRLDVTSAAHTFSLARQEAEWMLTQPIAAPADFSAVSNLISRLTTAQMQSVVAAPGSYGLDTPAATVVVGAGDARATLHIGAAAGEGAVYARDASRPEVFTIESSLAEALTKAASEYRQKDLFDARTFNATHLEVTRDGQTVAFERAKAPNAEGQDEEKWRQVRPDAKDVDGALVDAVISAATSTQAQAFVEDAGKAGLASPALTMVIKYDGGTKENRVAFGRTGAGAFAARSGVAGAATIDPAALDTIVKALDAVK